MPTSISWRFHRCLLLLCSWNWRQSPLQPKIPQPRLMLRGLSHEKVSSSASRDCSYKLSKLCILKFSFREFTLFYAIFSSQMVSGTLRYKMHLFLRGCDGFVEKFTLTKTFSVIFCWSFFPKLNLQFLTEFWSTCTRCSFVQIQTKDLNSQSSDLPNWHKAELVDKKNWQLAKLVENYWMKSKTDAKNFKMKVRFLIGN